MLVSDLATELALHAHDPNNAELSAANWLSFIASAARDARSSGWLIYIEDDETTTVAASDYQYSVPSTFAYVNKLLLEETIDGNSVYVQEIPRSHWEIRYDGSAAVFEFNTLTSLTVGKKIKVIGQKRPTIYTAQSDTIDVGMESFLRERALYFGFRYLAAGRSEYAQWRQTMSQQCWVTSEDFLRRHPQEFRMMPSATVVPGRA